MNIVKEEQFSLQDEIGELEEYKEERYTIEENKNNLEAKIQENEKKLEILKQINKIYEDKKLEEQKLEINQNLIKSYEEKVEKIEEEKDGIETKYKEITNIINEKAEKEAKENKKSLNVKKIGTVILFVISIIIGIIFIKNTLVSVIAFVIGTISLITLIELLINKKKDNEFPKEESEQQIKIKERLQLAKNEMDKMQAQIEMLNKSKEEKNAEIEKQKQEINSNIEERLNRLREIYQLENAEFNSNISYNIEKMQEELNKNRLELHSLELDKNNIMPKLERLASMEEQLQELNEKETMLNKQNSAIELAKEVLEIAYTKMKENVTPKFTENLSKNIEKISDGKYKKVKINDEEGIIVEKQNGEYISAEKLSVGTIEQLYLSLRFGAVKELSEESMPIILDEAFAYYDEERLKNILTYISKEYENNQIIIFTCTNREVEILDKENIKYNLVNL